MQIQRLQRSRDIEAVYRSGRLLKSGHLRLFWLTLSTPHDRLAIVVSTKISKQSTRRNRLRRIIRECVRLEHTHSRPNAHGHDIVLIVRANPRQEELMLIECRSLLLRAFGRNN